MAEVKIIQPEPPPPPPVVYQLTLSEDEMLHLAAVLYNHEVGPNKFRLFNELPE